MINVANRTQVKVTMESVTTLPKSCEKFRDNLAKEITKAPNPTRSSKHILQKIKGEKLYNQLSSHIINTDNKCTRLQTKPIPSNFKDFICLNKNNQHVITIIFLGQIRSKW